MSAENVKAFYQKFQNDAAKMQKELPDMTKNFMTLFENVIKDGVLPKKQKELIALAIAMAVRCEPCLLLHVQKSIEAGNSRQEILEAAAVVTTMQGGPGFTHIPTVLDALEALGK